MNKKVFIHFCAVLILSTGTIFAQERDKKVADDLLYEQLCANNTTENYHAPFTVSAPRLKNTKEKGIFLLQGDTFQIRSLSTDCYVRKHNSEYVPIFDSKYPMESFISLLLNHVNKNNLIISINQHLYGGAKKVPPMPMQNIYDMLSRNMNAYCSVTEVNKDSMKALLVFHHPKIDFIHMFIVTVPTYQLFKNGGTITAELYGNIPQKNVKSLFSNYKQADAQYPVEY